MLYLSFKPIFKNEKKKKKDKKIHPPSTSPPIPCIGLFCLFVYLFVCWYVCLLDCLFVFYFLFFNGKIIELE